MMLSLIVSFLGEVKSTKLVPVSFMKNVYKYKFVENNSGIFINTFFMYYELERRYDAFGRPPQIGNVRCRARILCM